MWPQPGRPLRRRPIDGHPRTGTARHPQLIQLPVRLAGEEGSELVLVLRDLERAGAVDQHATRPQQIGGARQDPALPLRAAAHDRRAPLPDGPEIAPEQRLAAAGGVEHRRVEQLDTGFGQPLHRGAHGHHVVGAPHVEALMQRSQTAGVGVHGQHQSVRSDERRQVGGLTAGCRGQIDDPRAVRRGQRLRDAHGRWFLQVEKASHMRRVTAEHSGRGQHESGRAPGHGLQVHAQQRPQRRRVNLGGVDPGAAHPVAGHSGQERGQLVTEQRRHALDELLRQVSHRTQDTRRSADASCVRAASAGARSLSPPGASWQNGSLPMTLM
jgi:hypothetical protein